MLRIFDADSARDAKVEEKAYQTWEREQKNIILGMSNVQKKQTAWSLLFPQVEHSEQWELSVSIF
jgi:hypothetical protein